MIHPVVAQFQAQAEVLDARASRDSLDEAMTTLAAWIDLARYRLTEDDLAVLVSVGGVLFREGLRRRLP